MKYLFEHCFDEFNYLISPSIEKAFFNKEGEFYIAAHKDFDILLYEFDKIIVFDSPESCNGSVIDYFDSLQKERFDFSIMMLKQSIKKLNSSDLEIITRKFIESNIIQTKSMYHFVFSNIAKMLLEENTKFLTPKEGDYLEVKEQLKNISSKIVCINGRNLKKNSFRNNAFVNLIENLIKKDFFVINSTMNPPGFQFSPEKYMEIESPISYSKNISYFLNSDCVISVADSGGINTHLLTQANFLLLGPGGWIDNPEFGFKGIDIVSARKSNQKTKTKHLMMNYDLDSIKNFIYSCNKPEVKSFFDESKLIKIQDL